ncbi:hypothetical protein [Clostridiisalibacter paucivorans]|uniref:hypothetical protein n=1 Tax=Clostridiisalibacter paucivorans TaxID=408753 RepID=UPI00047ADF32|nr:hypothetical protein [Clostridiisalibacter paucivorans]
MLNKALIYKEWKRTQWLFASLLGLTFVLKNLKIIMNIQNYKEFMPDITNIEIANLFAKNVFNIFDIQFFMFGILIFIAAFLFYDLRNQNANLISSMPFTREEIIVNKLFLGFTAIISTMLISFIFIIISYFSNSDILGPYISVSQLFQWFLINTLTFTAGFAFFMGIQSLMGNVSAASIISPIMLLFPLWFIEMGEETIVRLTSINYSDLSPSNIIEKLVFALYNTSEHSFYFNPEHNILSKDLIIYDNFMPKCITLLVLTIVFSLISIHIYKKNALELNGNFTMFKPLENVFIIGFSISLAMTFALVFAPYDIVIKNYIFLAIGLALGLFISKKIVESVGRS